MLALLAGAAGCGGDGRKVLDVPVVGDPVVVGSQEFANYNSSIGISGDGKSVAVGWNDYNDTDVAEQPYVAISKDGGATFAKPVLIDPTSPYVAYPNLVVVDDGTILAGVTMYDNGDIDGRAGLYRSAGSGAPFVKVADLADAPRVAFTSTGAIVAASANGKTVVLAWSVAAPDGSPNGMVAVVSTDGGATFGDAQKITERSAGGWTGSPAAFVDGDGHAGVVFETQYRAPGVRPTPADPNPGTPVLYLAMADDTGTFGDAVALRGTDFPSSGAGVGAAVHGDSVGIAWWETSDAGDTLMFAEWSGKALGEPAKIGTTETLSKAPPEVAIDDDGVAWIAIPDTAEKMSLLLFRSRNGKPFEPVDAAVGSLKPESFEPFALAGLPDGGVMSVWFDDAEVKVRRVDS